MKELIIKKGEVIKVYVFQDGKCIKKFDLTLKNNMSKPEPEAKNSTEYLRNILKSEDRVKLARIVAKIFRYKHKSDISDVDILVSLLIVATEKENPQTPPK